MDIFSHEFVVKFVLFDCIKLKINKREAKDGPLKKDLNAQTQAGYFWAAIAAATATTVA